MGKFWRKLNYWWEWEYEEKPRLEAMRGLELLLQDQVEPTVTTHGTVTVRLAKTSRIIPGDTFGNRWNAKGYWQIGSHRIFTDAVPTRLGAYLARVLLSIKYYSL